MKLLFEHSFIAISCLVILFFPRKKAATKELLSRMDEYCFLIRTVLQKNHDFISEISILKGFVNSIFPKCRRNVHNKDLVPNLRQDRLSTFIFGCPIDMLYVTPLTGYLTTGSMSLDHNRSPFPEKVLFRKNSNCCLNFHYFSTTLNSYRLTWVISKPSDLTMMVNDEMK